MHLVSGFSNKICNAISHFRIRREYDEDFNELVSGVALIALSLAHCCALHLYLNDNSNSDIKFYGMGLFAGIIYESLRLPGMQRAVAGVFRKKKEGSVLVTRPPLRADWNGSFYSPLRVFQLIEPLKRTYANVIEAECATQKQLADEIESLIDNNQPGKKIIAIGGHGNKKKQSICLDEDNYIKDIDSCLAQAITRLPEGSIVALSSCNVGAISPQGNKNVPNLAQKIAQLNSGIIVTAPCEPCSTLYRPTESEEVHNFVSDKGRRAIFRAIPKPQVFPLVPYRNYRIP